MEDVFGNGEEWCPLLGHTVSGDTVLKQQAPHSLEHPPPLTVYTHRQHQVLFWEDALCVGCTGMLMSRNEENFISSV